MKLSLAFTFHYLIFSGMIILLSDAKFIYSYTEIKEIGIEKKQRINLSVENTAEVLRADIFFKF